MSSVVLNDCGIALRYERKSDENGMKISPDDQSSGDGASIAFPGAMVRRIVLVLL